ncbi:MAG: hypothetical protein ACRDQ4_15755 [Pseudonocardiaceae bacterium]
MGQESPAHWARSPLDYHTHLLLPEGNHPVGVLKAHCGTMLPMSVTQHNRLPSGLTCERCHLNFLADSNARGSSHR